MAVLRDLPLDFGTIAVLALVVWLDGWRRLPADALLIERVAFGPWRVVTPSMQIGAFALVAWWAPFVIPVLLSPEAATGVAKPAGWRDDFGLSVARSRQRLARVGVWLALLRGYGIAVVVWIIAGIPVATALFGGRGLIYGVLGALLLTTSAALFTVSALGTLAIPFRQALRMAAPLLSPFTAPRAAELVTTTAVGPLHSLAPVAALLGDERFLAWLRPWAYDELASRPAGPETEDGRVAALVRELPRSLLERAIAPATREAPDDGARYCPRCTRTYREAVDRCSNCEDLVLVAL